MPPRQAVGEQAGDGGAAGVVGAEDLPQEDPERDQRRVDPAQPAGDGREGRCDAVLGEDVGEGQVAVLEELAAQGTDVLANGCLA